jgi:hypothetical protein
MTIAQSRLSLEVQSVDGLTWYYEEPKGIRVVVEIRDKAGNHVVTEQRLIPWRKVCNSVKRFHRSQEGRKT